MRIRKLLLGIALLCAAGAVAFSVKEAIDMRHPEYAVARLTVRADTEEIPVIIAGFTWDFTLGGVVEKPATGVAELNPTPVELLGGEQLSLVFSQPTTAVTVKRSESYSYSFYDTGGDLVVPYESGAYLYEVSASYLSGNVLYYFYVTVA